MGKDDRGKRFSCVKCGSSFIAYPPDDFHVYASIKESEIDEPVKMEYRCKDCGNINILYWGYQKGYFGVV